MKTLHNVYEKIENKEPITLAIGNFDGLHIGHQNLIEKTKMYSDTKSAVMTFFPHPMSVITDKLLPILMDLLDATNPSLKDEAEIMLYGHLLYIYPFKPDFSNEDIADAYAHYLQDLIGQSYDKNNHPEIRAWIEKIDKTMIENEQ